MATIDRQSSLKFGLWCNWIFVALTAIGVVNKRSHGVEIRDPWLVAVNMVSEGVDIPRLRVGVYASGVEKTYMQFDARNADRTNWYAQGRLTKSRWTDLKGYGGPNYFSIAGDSGNGRTWYVNAFYNGCPSDVGWFVILNNGHTNPCSWESGRFPTGVGILYGDFGVNRNEEDAHTLFVLDVTPTQWEKIEAKKLRLPKGWSLEGKIAVPQNGRR